MIKTSGFGCAQPSMNKETAQPGQFAQTSNLLFPGPGKSKMVKTSNQAIFMLVCFWLGAALHEQETAQSGQFAQSDFQFAFSRAGKKQNDLDFQLAFSRAGKKQNGQDFQPRHFDCPTLHEQETAQSGQFAQTSNLLFPGPGKSKMVQTSNLFFPRPGKSKRLRLPICFFPAREKAKLFQISNLLFPNPGKSNRKSEEQLFLQRGQVTNMTCADLSQDLREPFATAVRAQSKSAFEIRSLTRKRWVFERRSYDFINTQGTNPTVCLSSSASSH